MKNILSFLSIKNLKENIIGTFKRFSLSTILIFCIFLIFIYLNNFQEYPEIIQEQILRINLSLIITFFLSVGLYIFTETEKYNFLKAQGIQIISVIFGVGFYMFFGNNFNYKSIIFFIITTFGILSFLFFAPFLKEIFGKNKENKENYYNYLMEMIRVFAISFLIGILSSLLGFMAIQSVVYLFNFNDAWKGISNWIIFSCSFFAPFYTLSNIVKKENIKSDLSENSVNKASLFFINYIIFPFVITFFIILYAYSIKVLANFGDWPKGQVSWMVISFSAFAYIAYIASYKLKSKNIIFLRKIIPFAIIPQTFMLFYAIYVRIANYGLTINRYLVVVFGIFLLLTSLYLIFSKRKFIAVIPFLLTFFSIIISIGPWGIYNLPQKNQLYLLKEKLKQANILQENGEIIPLKNYSDIDKKLGVDIYSKIDYICDYYDCNEIKKLFIKQYEILEIEHRKEWLKKQKEDIERIKNYKTNVEKEIKENQKYLEKVEKRKYHGPTAKWEIIPFITKKIKVKRYYNEEDKFELEFYTIKNKVFDIKGYDKFIEISNSNFNSNLKYKNYNTKEKYLINLKDNTFILNNEIIKIPFNLKEKLIEEIKKINLKNKEKETEEDDFQKEPLIIIFENENKKYKFIISQVFLDIRKEKYDIYGVLLIGKK